MIFLIGFLKWFAIGSQNNQRKRSNERVGKDGVAEFRKDQKD